MKKYASTPDRMATLIPYVMTVLNVGMICIGLVGLKTDKLDLIMVLAITSAPLLLFVITVAMFYYQPLSITVDNNAIIINRRAKPVIIDFPNIAGIREVPESEMRGVIRTFGNGGVWAYTGKFYNRKIGSMTWYCTQRQNYILIEKTNKQKIVISPDQPNELLNDLRAQAPQLFGNKEATA